MLWRIRSASGRQMEGVLMKKLVLSTLIAVFGLSGTALAYNPPTLTLESRSAGELITIYDAGSKYPGGELAIDVYRHGTPFDTLLPGYPKRFMFSEGLSPSGPFLWQATGLPAGSYDVVESYGYSGEWHCSPSTAMGATLCEVPPVQAGPIPVL